MAKKKNKISLILICVLVAIVALNLVLFTACDKDNGGGNSSNNYTVKFMVRENGVGDWQVLEEKNVTDGKVELPANPQVEGLGFLGWFTEETCENAFDQFNVTSNMTVYAYMSDEEINLVVKDNNGAIKKYNKQKINALNDLKVEENNKALESGLVFDGWYTNEECTTEYAPASGSTVVYGRYMAEVVFDNGYEVVKDQLINPGETIKRPEINDVRKFYMDEEDIYFVNLDGITDYDFNKPINTNTKIKVIWKSPCLNMGEFSLKLIPGTENEYSILGFEGSLLSKMEEFPTYPVVSLPHRLTFNNQEIKIVSYETVSGTIGGTNENKLEKVIFNEGVKQIRNLTSGAFGKRNDDVKEIVLPSTLKVLENSFNGYKAIENVKLPEGLEVIIDCFWKNAMFGNPTRTEGYDFDITIPASVKYMVNVPANLKFAENSPFFVENNRVYKNDEKLGKVLVSEFAGNIVDGNLIIPEGVDAIQVGALEGITCDYLTLPKTFKGPSYNGDRKDYPFYVGDKLTDMDALQDTTVDPKTFKTMNDRAYCIVSNLNNYDFVVVNNSAFDQNMNPYTFRVSKNSYLDCDPVKVGFIGEKEEGQVDIYVTWQNKGTGVAAKQVKFSRDTNQILTENDLLVGAGLTTDLLGYEPKIIKLTSFNKEYNLNNNVNTNLYLELEIGYSKMGISTKLTEDGKGYIVTGFDVNQAQNIGEPEDPRYLVIIPDTIDGIPVVEIKESAFEKNQNIARVLVGKNVKKIGANAFRAAGAMEEIVMKKGSLQSIGAKAFEYVGCLLQDDVYRVNPTLPLVNDKKPDQGVGTVIHLPLSSLKELGPNAFNSQAIRYFTIVEGEESRPVVNGFVNGSVVDLSKAKFTKGQYYFYGAGNDRDAIGIVKYVEDSTYTANSKEFECKDFDYCATAAGYKGTIVSGLAFGLNIELNVKSLRMNVLEGSVAFYEESSKIQFAVVKHVAKGAFTYLHDSYTSLTETNTGFVCNRMEVMPTNSDTHGDVDYFTEADLIKNQDPSIFDEGWFVGKTNEECSVFMTKLINAGNTTPGFY